MTPQTAQKYIGESIRVNYHMKPRKGDLIRHSRVGICTHVTTRRMILLTFNDDNGEGDDFEIYVPLKTIKNIYSVKGEK
jgi:hypothetical protein